MGGQNFPPSAPSLWGQPQTLGVLLVVAVHGLLLFHRAPESARRLSSPKCLLKAALGSPACAIRCCEPHSLLVKCFWRSILFFKYKSTEYRFPVDEDGSFFGWRESKAEKSSSGWCVNTREHPRRSSLCKVKYCDLQEPRRSQVRRSA